MNKDVDKLPLCKICGGRTENVFEKLVLLKYRVGYFRCSHCGFIQTEEPYWLDEAYTPPTSSLDIGAACRPVVLAHLTSELINFNFNADERFLDYGGGVGLFVRLMRDRGYRFFRFDKFCSNIFAQYFDFEDVTPGERSFELVTCFEVLEHATDPLAEVTQIFQLGKHLFCTTSLQPESSAENVSEWPYVGAEHGQHVSFFTRRSLEILSERFGRYLYTNGQDLHLLSKRRLQDFNFGNIQRRTLPYRGCAAAVRFMQGVVERMLAPRPLSTPKPADDEEFVMKRFLAERRNGPTRAVACENGAEWKVLSGGVPEEEKLRFKVHPMG